MTELLWHDVYKKIKQLFFNAGITDDLGILEPLGFFFLGLYKGVIVETGSLFEVDPEQTQYILEKNFPDSELPHPPSFGRGSFDKKFFARQIVDLISSINNEKLGRFYEYCITTLITEIKTGGRYTTPRHITKFLGDVAGLEPNRSLADFACGSGGILLNAEYYNVQKVFGYEISPNWARIALANLLLHGIEHPKIIVGDSFNQVAKSDHFDDIVMNPPFGLKINTRAKSSSRFGEYTSQSEIAFLQLGLDHLSEGGTLITLLPSGFLFSTGKQNRLIKEYLIENSLLQSVLTFPDDTFQPYSNIQTHLLEIKNEKSSNENNLVWFYRPRYDGFTAGRNREKDPNHNDLPLIQNAMTWKKSRSYDKNKSGLFRVDSLNSDGKQGYRIASDPKASIYGWESKKKDNLQSTVRYGLSNNRNSFLFKYKENERNNITVFFNKEKFQTEGDSLTPIKLSKDFSQDFPKNGLQIDYEELKSYFISPKGIQKKNQIVAQFKPPYSELAYQKPSNLCFLVQPDIGYFSKQMMIENTDWLPENLHPPCILPVESADQGNNEDSTFYLLIWDNFRLNGFPLIGNRGTKGYFRTLSSGEDLFMVQYEQQADDYYFIIFDHKNSKALPEKAEGVLLDHECVVLGVGVSEEVVGNKRYDLMPSTYIPEEKETEEVLLSPAYILGNIKKNQIELTNSLNNLLHIVENKLPSEYQSKAPQFPLSEYIDKELKTKWKNLPENYFQLIELNEIEIEQQTLDLLVSLGLLLEVKLGDGIYYRRLEKQDVQAKVSHEN